LLWGSPVDEDVCRARHGEKTLCGADVHIGPE